MSVLVDPTEIERIVGAARHPDRHLGRAVSAEQTVYILHSQECKDSGIDLRECIYSLALDAGIDDLPEWGKRQDQLVILTVVRGRLYAIRGGLRAWKAFDVQVLTGESHRAEPAEPIPAAPGSRTQQEGER